MFSKTNIKIIIATLVFLFAANASSARAQDYFIDATWGNDTNTGTDEAHPWKSASKASGTFSPGDNIKFKNGETWGGGFTINSVGTIDNPITFTSYGSGSKPKIRPTTVLTDWSGPDANGVYTTQRYGVSMIMEDRVVLSKASDPSCSNGNWYYISPALYYKPTSGTPSDHLVERMGIVAVSIAGGVSNVVIDGLAFEAAGNAIYNSHNASSGISNITIQNCHSEKMGAAFYIQTKTGQNMTGINILNNTFDYCGNNIYIVENGQAMSTVRISGNIITHSNEAYGSSLVVGDREGISLQNLKNSIIENNEISGSVNCLNGIVHWISDSTVDATGNIFRYNYIHDVIGRGIVSGGVDNGNANCKIYGNVIANFGKTTEFGLNGGLRLNKSQTSGNPSEVFNNTIYNGDVGILLNSLTDNYIVKNNIVFNMSSYLVGSYGPISHNRLENNLYHSSNNNAFLLQSKSYDFNSWKSATLQDVNSSVSDPLFLNSSGNFSQASDFKLSSTSPAKAGSQ